MPGYVCFQLSLELAQIVPVEKIVESSFQKFVSYATELRKSGSDIIVKASLVDVFGRGILSHKLEKAFKDKV
jgi:hypothetical protein